MLSEFRDRPAEGDRADTLPRHMVERLVQMATAPAPEQDIDAVERIHQGLTSAGPRPVEHYVDAGYVTPAVIAKSANRFGIALIGPVRPDTRAALHPGFAESYRVPSIDPTSCSICRVPPIGRYAATVPKLIYSAIASLDGYVEDEHGEFGWAAPDAEVFAFVNELERPIGTYLYGRRMYETMAYWETVDSDTLSAQEREFTDIWRAADKIVYSRTLQTPWSARTRIEPAFDPAAISQLKESETRDLTVGGAELASTALAAGLVDELHLILTPIIVGGGKPALPDNARIRLELLDERRFKGGTVYLRYSLRASDTRL